MEGNYGKTEGGSSMLNIVFGRDNCEDPGYILDPRIYFTKHKKPEWFENDFDDLFMEWCVKDRYT